MNSIKQNKIDLGKTPVKKVFWTYAIPSILAMIAQSTAGLIDSIFIGRFVGPLGLSAITLVMPIIMILIGTAAMIAIGGTTLAGIELGKNNKKTSNNYFNTTIFLLSVTAILATLTILIFADKAADLINARGLTKTYILDYSKTIGLFFVFFMLNFAFSFFLKLDGKPITVVIITLTGTLINIVLDYLLISKFNMAMKGAGLATGLSQLIPWILFMITIHRKSIWQFRIPILRLKEIWRMVFNGSSEFLSTMAISISGMIFNLIIIKRIGISGISGYAVALQIAHLATSFNYGFAESVQSGISYNFGAGNLKRVKEFLKMSLTANLATGILLFLFSFFFGKHIAGVFVSNTSTIALAEEILKFYSFAFIFMGVNITVGTYYTSVDDPILSAFIMLFRSLISLIIGLLILPLIFGISGIWASVIFAEFTTLIVSIVLLKKKPYGSSKLHLEDNSSQIYRTV